MDEKLPRLPYFLGPRGTGELGTVILNYCKLVERRSINDLIDLTHLASCLRLIHEGGHQLQAASCLKQFHFIYCFHRFWCVTVNQ